MNKHFVSKEDQAFKDQVESCAFPVSEFDHRSHLRLAYIYLAENNRTNSVRLVRGSLVGLLRQNGIEPSAKYHETLTEAWVLTVQHFMNKTDSASSADAFIDQNVGLLNSDALLRHYSAELLFSEKARQSFVAPDLVPLLQ